MGAGAKAQRWVASLWDSPTAGMLLRVGSEPCLHPGALPAAGRGGLPAMGAGKQRDFARCCEGKVLLLTRGS